MAFQAFYASSRSPGSLKNYDRILRSSFSAVSRRQYRSLSSLFSRCRQNTGQRLSCVASSYVRPTLRVLSSQQTPASINAHGARWLATEATAASPENVPDVIETSYGKLIVGVPKETFPGECRVAITPQNVALLLKRGFPRVLIERGAGEKANFSDYMYEAAGGTIVEQSALWSDSNIILKVRPPRTDSKNSEVDTLREGSVIISFLQPAQNKPLVEAIAARKATSFAMDMIPRISRAQVFDALSSMANSAGYKAVLEASNHFGRFLVGQTTAAGKIPPSKVLVIGAGVAGLSAITTARRMGAIVRGFDTRAAAREQVQSLGADFLEVTVQEDGSGAGGYGKVMSKEFIEAEMKLFMQQAKEVDIIITTALIPGKPAPKLILKEHVAAMRPGSVIVDLAAETGGNCEVTVPGKASVYEGVTVIGYTDLPSRLPTQSSTLYSNNITKFLLSISKSQGSFGVDMKDEVTRGAIVTHNGEIIPPAPRAIPPPGPAPQPKAEQLKEVVALTPWQKTVREVTTVTGGMGAVLALGKFTSPLFMSNVFTTGLAGLIGYRVVWGVSPALHSPLMSVTNAISGIMVPHWYVYRTIRLTFLLPFRYGRHRRILHHGRRLAS